ncbi:MAG: hypothetical protein LBQ83_02960 [Candidatus Margulisbacteria bacterium]|jgi:hypothetical protein|nr:hypothetical protein [Candidatus Margulisiibacteriota bacterium]
MRGVAKLLVLGAVLCALVSAVEKIPVSLKGDNLLYQDDKITASGNARLAYNEYVITAEHIVVDTQTNQIEGRGQVRIAQADTLVEAGYFWYDLNSEQLKIQNVDTTFAPDFSASKVFVSFYTGANYAPTGLLTQDKWSGHGVSFTTCDLDSPHSWFSASEFLYYPDDRVAAYHLTAHFWFSPLPVLYTPYYVFYTGPRRVVFTFPKVGANEVEGRFLKTETLYFLDEFNEGGVYWDMMSAKGNGSGFWHRYNPGNPGYFSFYQVAEQDTRPQLRRSYALRWQQQLTLSAYDRLDLEHRYRKMYLLPQGYDDSLNDTLRYRYEHGADRLAAEYSFSEDYQARREAQKFQSSSTLGANANRISWQKDFRQSDGYRYEALNLDEAYQLSPEWRYHINPVYYRTKTALNEAYEQRMDVYTDLQLNPREKKYFDNIKIEANYYYDLDGDGVTADALTAEFVEKAPELTVKALRYDVLGQDEASAWFSIDSSYSSGWLREAHYFGKINGRDRRRFFETAKYTANYNFYKTYRPGWASLTLAKSYNQAAYATQDQHYQISDRPYINTDWWGFFRNKLEYEHTQSEGGSPFFYDDPSQYRTNRGRHTSGLYYRKFFEFTATAGKDFENLLYDDDLYNLRLDPLQNGEIKFNLSTGQSRYTYLYRDLVGGVQISRGRSAYRFNYTKDINRNFDDNAYAGKLKTASSELDFYWGQPYEQMNVWNFWLSEWHFLLSNTYDFNTEYYNLNTFAFGKDLHCWYMRYHFTPARKEWYVVFTLKAFPQQEFKLTGNEDNEFNFDAFSDTLRATDVRRYD